MTINAWSLQLWRRRLVVVVEDVGSEGVGYRVEDREDSSRDPAIAPRAASAIPEAREDHYERDEVEDSDDDCVEILELQPAEGKVHLDRVLHLEEIEEAPQQREDEGGDHDEEEPVIVAHSVGKPTRGKKEYISDIFANQMENC